MADGVGLGTDVCTDGLTLVDGITSPGPNALGSPIGTAIENPGKIGIEEPPGNESRAREKYVTGGSMLSQNILRNCHLTGTHGDEPSAGSAGPTASVASVPLDPGSAASEFYVPLVRGIYGSRGICALGSQDSEVNAIHAKLAVTTDSNTIHAKLMPFANLINDLVPGSGTHGSRHGVSCRLGCNRDPVSPFGSGCPALLPMGRGMWSRVRCRLGCRGDPSPNIPAHYLAQGARPG